MSMMRCECDRMIDTDFNCEGVWEDGGQHRYWCDVCLENRIADELTADNDACMAAFKRQDPTAYAEVVADYATPIAEQSLAAQAAQSP